MTGATGTPAGSRGSEPDAEDPANGAASARVARSSRATGVVWLLVLAALVGLSSLPTWVRATGVGALTGDVPVHVSGSQAAPVVPAAALALAAAGVAVALAGRVGRWVVVAVVALGGLAVVAASAAVLADAGTPAAAAAATQTGVGHLTGPASVTAGPWVAAVVGVLVVAAAVLLARSSARWAAPSRRHEVGPSTPAPPAAGAPDERDDWDALTRGSDPSDESGEGAGR
ncbi:MAG TPA: Trp biosynthesis-associated membrane protein [Cellulomonas sp.]